MRANFEVMGWGPAPSRPLGADVLLAFSPNNPRDTAKLLKGEVASNRRSRREAPTEKRALYFLQVLAKQNSVMGRIKGYEEKRVGGMGTLQRGAQWDG